MVVNIQKEIVLFFFFLFKKKKEREKKEDNNDVCVNEYLLKCKHGTK